MFAKNQVPNLLAINDLPVRQLTIGGQGQDLAFCRMIQRGHQRPSCVQDLLPRDVFQVGDVPDDARPVFASRYCLSAVFGGLDLNDVVSVLLDGHP